MKTKLITGLLATATVVACLTPATVRATEVTTGEDSVISTTLPAAPTQCVQDYEYDFGPARAAHSAARPGILVDAPDCEDVEGICVEVVFPAGGAGRSPHEVVTTTPVDTPVEPCVPAGPACDITVQIDPSGPARAAHQPSNVARPQRTPFVVVDIPQACQDVLSAAAVPTTPTTAAAAIPTTGGDSTNVIWLGVVLVGLGAVLLTTRRVATVRSR